MNPPDIHDPNIPIIGEEVPKAPFRIALSMPSHQNVPSLFAYDLASMVGTTVSAFPEIELKAHMVHGTYIHTMRNDLAGYAIANDCTHMLWIDTDMRFPRDALLKLLRHNLPIVGINYSQRKVPNDFVAIKKMSHEKGKPAAKLWTREDSTGLEECEAIGFGLVLMNVGVYGALGPPPWFENYWQPDRERWMGEDVHFCKIAREAGFQIFVDHDLSKECAHIGEFEFKPAHAETYQQHIIDHKGEQDGADDLQRVEDGDRDVAESERPDDGRGGLHLVGGSEAETGPEDEAATDGDALG